ncbi:helicase HerA domain-containing protein [Methanobacterium aggregans]|uniref:helicase HerA domain-containing protein n=1 Tax=Methanobacterium aggregans TaxID=1615586 RepID=UPI001AE21C72|nr:ATP-binding protein [Methanobacterium aggregans]MBP2045439.1 DNA helicase HerA-like ATPase [Methanobacterium aggregans]
MNEVIGRCVGETSPTQVSFISKEMPRVGEYVSLEYDGKKVLGMIEALVRGSVSINGDIYDPKTIERIKEIEGDDHYIKGSVKILGDINDLKIPRTPAPPGTAVEVADPQVLKKIFHVENSGLKLGNLITQEEVEVEVDINKMVTRHLAVLAMTGAGKSNTVSVIVDGLLGVNGSVLIFDMHSEYVNTEFGKDKVNLIKPQINPLYLSFAELKKLSNIPSNAYVQERYFRKAYRGAQKTLAKGLTTGNDFLALIENQLESWILEAEADSSEGKSGNSTNAADRKSITDVLNKLQHMRDKYGNILSLEARDVTDNMELGKANIIDLGSVDEFASDVIVSHVLRNVLKSRKEYLRTRNGIAFPIFSILEEAHILAPQNRSTESKLWISRIAREGRKFGVGLCLVSQSPKSLDSDALSQANNMIILRLVEPTDQNHVQRASESLSDDLIAQLPSLNIGEAIVLGLMTKIPTLVKVDEFQGKVSGGDLNIVEEWSKSIEDDKKTLEEQKREYEDLGGDY